jgi:hypothetical protein
MKNITPFLFLLITFSLFAQSPEKMSYQAVIRDATNTLVTNQSVGMQISILQTTTTGTAIYTETQTVSTNTNGLLSLEIGMGVTSDDFSAIDWKAGPYFIKTETDPTGGSSYTITGTSQLMSVPFAMYAKTSGDGITTEQSDAIETNTAKTSMVLGTTAETALAGDTPTIATVQADAIAANTAKVGITTEQAGTIAANTAKTGITSDQATAIKENTAKLGYTEAAVSANTAVVANTLKVGITAQQASDITSNNAKTVITTEQAGAIAANTAKTGITSAQSDAILVNAAKLGYTEALVSANADVAANTAKVGITAEQAGAIAANTAKTGITTEQSDAINTNTIAITETVKTTGDQSIDGAKTFTNETTQNGGIKLGNDNKIRWTSDDVYIAGTTAGDNLSFVLGGQEQFNISQTLITANLPIVGNLTGDVTGDLTGDVTGNVTGDVTGNLAGNVTGNVIGDVVGNLTGDVTGNLTGDVTGDVTGNVTGDVSSNYVNTQILKLLSLTNSEIDALTPEEGMLVYNETFRKIQIYSPGSTNISNTNIVEFTNGDDSMRQSFVNKSQGEIASISVYGQKTNEIGSDIIIDFEGSSVNLFFDYWDSQGVNNLQWHTFTFATPIPVNAYQTYEFKLWGPGNCSGNIVFAKNNSYSGGSVVSSGNCGGTPVGFANGEDLVFIINYVNAGVLGWNNLN